MKRKNNVIEVTILDNALYGKTGEYLEANDFYDMDKWAQDNCASYIGYEVNDISDFSLVYDLIGIFEFREEKDAAWFSLKWSS